MFANTQMLGVSTALGSEGLGLTGFTGGEALSRLFSFQLELYAPNAVENVAGALLGERRFAGYMVGWNLWAFAIVIMATFSVMIATNVSYLLGPGFAFVTRAWWYTPALSAATIASVTLVAVLGLRVGKWIQNLGGAAQFFTYGALVVVPFVALSRGTIDSYEPLQAAVPQATPFNLNIFGKMARARSPASSMSRSWPVSAATRHARSAIPYSWPRR